MEPSELDKLIRQKQKEAKDLYQQERDTARNKIWSSVHSELEKKKSMRWYHLAAAVVLILIPIAIAFNSMKRSGAENLLTLTSQVNQLQEDYRAQAEQLNEKDNKLATLQAELMKMEKQLQELENNKLQPQTEKFVYVRDTVYIKQIEYITTIAEPVLTNEAEDSIEQMLPDAEEPELTASNAKDDIIFLSHQRKKTSDRPESLKVQIGSLATRN